MDAHEALDFWQAEGEIDTELADRLRTSLAAHEGPARTGTIIWILASLGAVLIGGGLLLFISSQWDQSSPTRRLLLVLAIYLAIVGAAALAERQRLAISARGLWFLSSIAVGVNIFLVGQIFNLPLNYWQGTLLWMTATLAMGWAAPSSAQGWLAVPLGLLTLAWISTPSAEFFDQGAFLWDARGIRPLLPIIGLALVASTRLLAETEFGWLNRPAIAMGALLAAVPLTVSTFHPVTFAWLFQIDFRLFHVVVITIAAAVVALVARRRADGPLAIAFVTVGGLLLVLLPQVADDDNLLDSSTVPWAAPAFDGSDALFFVYGAIVFALAVALITAGQHFGVRWPVNAGFAMAGVILFAVYVGRIAGALPTALAVTLGGLLLVGGAIFVERKRWEVNAGVGKAGPG